MNPKVETLFKLPCDTSWHFERVLKPDDKTIGNYTLIQPGATDIVKVLGAYFHHPVLGYNIASIEIVYNEQLNRVFYGNMKMMNSRKGNLKYTPTWKGAAFDVEKQQREATFQQFQNLSQPHGDPDVPNMHLLPLWHGTQDDVAEYIFNMGYGIFQTNPQFVTDEGYFGKGVYTAHEAEYSFRSYAKQHGDKAVLLLNWVSSFEAYPIIPGDMPKVQGKPMGYDNCDAHFIPVRSDQHPHTNIYYPCGPHQSHQYLETVVFNPAQCLPRYKVKLVPSIPKPSIDDTALMAYQMGLDFLGLGQTAMVCQAFEQAHDADHPAASIRLHWLHSGGSGVISANQQELQKYQTLFNPSLNWLKQQANFRGNNDQESQFNLGWCYQHGLGAPVNLAKAAQYYWIAANQGHRDAQYQLGVCCASGIGVKQNMHKAIFYYEQAAAKGHVHAHYLLSQCYEYGLGVVPDSTKAALHKQAAQQGNHPQLAKLVLLNPAATSSHEDKKMILLEQTIQQQKSALQQQEDALKQERQRLKQQENISAQDQQKIMGLTQTVLATQQKLQAQEGIIMGKQIEIEQHQQQAITQAQALARREFEMSQQESNLTELKIKLGELENALQASQERELNLAQQLKVVQKQQTVSPIKIVNPSGIFPSVFQAVPSQPLKHSEQVANMSQQVMNQINRQDLAALLKWGTEGQLVEVEKLLQKDPKLALATGTVTDLSDRTFQNITVLQYAAWALDIEMCELITKYIEPPYASMQLKALSNKPQRYSRHGACYDIEPLITKTETYLDNYSKWDSAKCRRYWQKEVGGEQRKCPAWLIYSWSEEGADVAWTKKDLKRKINREYDKHRLVWWMTENYNSGMGVGSTWAVGRGRKETECWNDCSPLPAGPHIDKVAAYMRLSDRALTTLGQLWDDHECLKKCRQFRHESMERFRAKSDSQLTQATRGPGK